MKKIIISVAAFFGVSSIALTSCRDHLPQEVQEQWEEKQGEVTDAVSAEMKEALISQMDDFLQSDDLEESLGFTDEQLTEVEQSVEQYIENYEFDTESLTSLVGEIKLLFEKTEGLSKDEIQAKLDEILENESTK